MKNRILNHRYPIGYKGNRRMVVKFLRRYFTQTKWFHYFYHRLFGHRFMDNTGYDWCEYCNYHQELFMDSLYPVS